jgi:hypothetical protein
MFVEQLIKKKECMISGFLEEGGVFLSWLALFVFTSLILFIS